jgi:hypothetical protein
MTLNDLAHIGAAILFEGILCASVAILAAIVVDELPAIREALAGRLGRVR